MAKPWERLDDETDAPWRVFEVFLTMPAPRSLEGLGRLTVALGPPGGYAYDTLRTWSQDWLWFPRARAFDEHLARRARRAQERATESKAAKLARQQLRVWELALGLAKRKLEAMAKADPNGSTASVHEAIRAAKEATHAQRLILGEVTERVEAKADLSKLSLEELREARRLRDKAEGKDK